MPTDNDIKKFRSLAAHPKAAQTMSTIMRPMKPMKKKKRTGSSAYVYPGMNPTGGKGEGGK
jgi:hypothetical protein